VIPYFDIATFHIAGLTFHTFGLLVALGTIAGHAVVSRRAKELGLGPPQQIDVFVLCVFVGGYFFGHVFDTLAYHPALIARNPLELFMVHHGLSSFGGVTGAFIGGLSYLYAKGLDRWAYTDLCTYAFPFGWIFGRAGCAIAHDHRGRLTDSWLAVRFPDGPRYDLGLIEWCFTPLFCLLVVWVGHRTRRPGAVSAAMAISYAVVRFPLDFLRATDLGPEGDVRYAGLTPGQWACFATLGFGLWALQHARTHPEPEVRA
jgi:phosphatidylglycerol:prolipoprotein diacylglycerol transferase